MCCTAMTAAMLFCIFHSVMCADRQRLTHDAFTAFAYTQLCPYWPAAVMINTCMCGVQVRYSSLDQQELSCLDKVVMENLVTHMYEHKML